MLTVEPTGAVLGAIARGIDLAQPLGARTWAPFYSRLDSMGLALSRSAPWSRRSEALLGTVRRNPVRRRNLSRRSFNRLLLNSAELL